MGQSTNGILFYGYVWTGEDVDLLEHHRQTEDGDDPEWEEVILAARGVQNPWDSHANDGANRKALDEWYEQKRRVREESSCDISHHCSGDFPMPYIYVKGTEHIAARGSAVEILVLTQDDAWDAELTKFVTELGISLEAPNEYSDAPKGPSWFLVSYWG